MGWDGEGWGGMGREERWLDGDEKGKGGGRRMKEGVKEEEVAEWGRERGAEGERGVKGE